MDERVDAQAGEAWKIEDFSQEWSNVALPVKTQIT